MAHTSNNKKLRGLPKGTVTKRVEQLEAYQLYQDEVFQELEDKIAKLEKDLKQLQGFTLKFFVNTYKLPEQN